MNSQAQAQDAALRDLRNRCRGKVSEDGIFLVIRFRDCYAADDFEALVAEAGGDVIERCKTHKTRYVGDRTHRITFSVGIDADAYLAGRINLREMRAFAA